MAKDPAFLFYSKDWLTGTKEMMPIEKGVYIDLLCYQHQNGSIPSDTKRIAVIASMSHEEFLKVWDILKDKFQPVEEPNGIANGARLANKRLTEITSVRKSTALTNRINGSFAAVLRKLNLSKKEYIFVKSGFSADEFTEIPTERLTECLSNWCSERLKSIGNGNADANGDVNEDTDSGGLGEKEPNISFETFWNAYDKKRGDKEKLSKKWGKLTDAIRTEIMAYVPKYVKATPDKEYRKNPETFLNNKTWEDELPKPGGQVPVPYTEDANKFDKLTTENFWGER